MNKIILYILVFITFSCNNSQKENVTKQFKNDIISTEGNKKSKDSIVEPMIKVLDQKKLKKVVVGKPDIVKVKSRISKIGLPIILNAEKPKLCIPGTDTFAMPKLVQIKVNPIAVKQPKPTMSLPLRMNANANCNIQYLDIEQGLSASSILSIIEDKSGNFWIATLSSGLIKYDGKSFWNYTLENGLTNNIVLTVIQDKNGNIWFGTNGGGVTKYDGKKFTHIGQKEGLKDSYVRQIFEDSMGNIWIATQFAGVTKLIENSSKAGNGYSLINYTVKEGLCSNYINSIAEDAYGNMWFGSFMEGASVFDGNRVDAIELKAKKRKAIPSKMKQGLVEVNGKLVHSFKNFNNKNDIGGKNIRAIVARKDGTVCFGIIDYGLFIYNPDKEDNFKNKSKNNNFSLNIPKDTSINQNEKKFGFFQLYTDKSGMTSNIISSLFEDTEKNLWIGYQGNGVSKFDGKSVQNYSESDGLSDNIVLKVIQDSRGNYWFATFEGGLSKLNSKSFVYFQSKDGLLEDEINFINEDNFGNLWFATNKGLSKYDGEKFENFTQKQGLPDDRISYIFKDKNGDLWLSTDQNGVIKYVNNNAAKPNAIKKPFEVEINSMQGKVEPNSKAFFIFYNQEAEIPPHSIKSIDQDNEGNLWFGTVGMGLTKLNLHFKNQPEKNAKISPQKNINNSDKQSITRYGTDQGLYFEFISATTIDKNGNLWIGEFGKGISNFSESKEGKFSFLNYPDFGKTQFNHVNTMMSDINDELWFGTFDNGLLKSNNILNEAQNKVLNQSDKNSKKLNLYKPVKYYWQFNHKDGLQDKTVWSITEQKLNNKQIGLWLGLEKGLSFFDTKANYFYNFNREDGLKSLSFKNKAAFLDSKNRIWWGTQKAVCMLDLNKFEFNKSAPKVQLNHIEIQNKFLDFNSFSSQNIEANSLLTSLSFYDVEPFCNYPLGLKLPYHLNHLTFNFSAIDWYAPQHLKYQFKLEGLERDWSAITSDNFADYRNIPPGKYTFYIKAIGSANLWSNIFEYKFEVLPPWWRTWWAYTLYFLTGLTCFFLYIKWHERSLIAKQKLLEKKVDEATVEIRSQKEVIVKEKQKSEDLLLNILPEKIAEELKLKGSAETQLIDEVTVLFTDFKGFTQLSEKLTAKELVNEIHECFSNFDLIMQKYGVEKIKTIGDAYMAAGGLPVMNNTHPVDVVNAALDIQKFMEKHKKEKQEKGELYFEIRIGIHTGPIVAGIVGVKKFAYDIWGDTVNTASRMESSGEVGKINISETTYNKIAHLFECSYRGEIDAKGKGKLKMYFVEKPILIN